MRIITKKREPAPSQGDLNDGQWHELRPSGGRRKTDTGFETIIICHFCSSEYAVDDRTWFDVSFLQSILDGKFECPVCQGKWPTFFDWKTRLMSVEFTKATPGEAAAKMFFLIHDEESKVRYRVERLRDSFPKELREEFGVKDCELDLVSDPIIVSMVYRLCRLGEKVKNLEDRNHGIKRETNELN